MMPFRIYDYPLPAVMPEIPMPRAGEWPLTMASDVLKFQERTSHLPSHNHVYFHVPFCPFKCSFCPFYKNTNHTQMRAYVEGVLHEIDLYARIPKLANRTYQTVYFGGGTPSELSTDDFSRILAALRGALQLAPDVEITLEGVAEQMMEPGYLERCQELGFTRIAIGVQSLDPKVRKAIGRGNDSVEANREAVELANRLGLRANAELMMACPDQDEESLQSDLNEVIRWQPASVDVDAYKMIPGTSLYTSILRGRRKEPGYGARLMRMHEMVTSTFLGAGYRLARAEVFVRNDTHRFLPSSPEMVGNSLHTHLAFGPSAIGHIEGTAFRNVSDISTYLAAVHEGRFPIDRAERLNRHTAARRALLYAMGALYVPDVLISSGRHQKLFASWHAEGLVDRVDGAYRLTEHGFHWEGQMQIALLGLAGLWKGARMLGSYAEQEQLASRQTELGREFLTQVAGRSRVKKAGYMLTLKALKHLPVISQRPIGLLGELEAEHTTSPLAT